MAFSKLFGIFTYSEDLTGFKEKALMSSGLRKGLIAMAVLGCCSGGTIAAVCNNSQVNAEVTEQAEKPKKDKAQIIAEICQENIETNTSLNPNIKNTCVGYVNKHQSSKTTEATRSIPEVKVV